MVKTKFVCSACGFESQKWYGRCPSCNNWNTLSEVEVVSERDQILQSVQTQPIKVEKAKDIKTHEIGRIGSGFEEFDRVLGGGIVPGSVILLSGDPGIGKSTLLLQVALNISKLDKRSTFYVTGEESSDQVKLRTERLVSLSELAKRELYIISATHIEKIVQLLAGKNPSLVIVDSIQTMESGSYPGFPGSIPQIRHATSLLIAFAKSRKIPVILVGHVTKEGIVAGPMLLSHMVDAVLYLEGEEFSNVRMVRAFKNRFGDASEVGIFTMAEKGLMEIKDVADFFIDKKSRAVPGSCVTVTMEGSRPILAEIQALVVPSVLSFARRVSTGLSDRRLELLLAVIQKHMKLPLFKFDVFVNVVGGMKIIEPSADLAVCLAVISSFKNKALSSTVAVSEVGLLGELRTVARLEKRISEARKFGFKKIVTFKDYTFLSEITL